MFQVQFSLLALDTNDLYSSCISYSCSIVNLVSLQQPFIRLTIVLLSSYRAILLVLLLLALVLLLLALVLFLLALVLLLLALVLLLLALVLLLFSSSITLSLEISLLLSILLLLLFLLLALATFSYSFFAIYTYNKQYTNHLK